ncbi:MAG: hypothetical protein AB7V26_07545 [Lysobacterales bacterium]|uniref:hypothetical protein n=1 Tax=Hydrogenophaga sp. TaxID=1904254 RepID=UPI003D1090EF
MQSRLLDCHHSFHALPLWVRLWVAGILIPVNVLPFFLLHTETGRWAALAALLVVATNMPIMLIERGMSRLMSVPHLIAWIPLLVWLLLRINTEPPLAGWERALALALIAINGLSLVFDLIDTLRWLRGERAVPGFAAAG